MTDGKLKARLSENLFGTHISMTDSIVSEILGSLGFDFLWIDSEHSENSITTLRNHLTAVKSGGTPAIIRTQMNDYNYAKKVMELGPDGIIFPMINTAEQAENAMKFVMYPPYGIRGFGPLRACDYGNCDMNTYIRDVDRFTCRFIQIETAEAVQNLTEIVKNPYIDGYFFGPCDLSGSIGELNNVFGEHTQELIHRAITILKAEHKPIGVSTGSTDKKTTGFWHDMGINLISSGTDYDYIYRGASENLSNLRSLL